MARKVRVTFKTTPEEFIKQWFALGGLKSKLAEHFGGVTEQTIGKYAAFLRKEGVHLPLATRGARKPRPKAQIDVKGLNDLIKSLNK